MTASAGDAVHCLDHNDLGRVGRFLELFQRGKTKITQKHRYVYLFILCSVAKKDPLEPHQHLTFWLDEELSPLFNDTIWFLDGMH